MTQVRKTGFQQLAKYLPFVGLALGTVAIGALLGSLPVLGSQGMMTWRALQAIVYTAFILWYLSSETSQSDSVTQTVLCIVLAVAFTLGWFIYLI